MFKRIVLMLLVAITLQASTPKPADALLIGVSTAGAGATLSFIFGLTGMTTALLSPNSDAIGLFLIGAVLDQDGKQAGSDLRINEEDLREKVQLGLYTNEEADLIRADLARLNEANEGRAFEMDITGKAGAEIRDEIVTTLSVAPITATYLAASAGAQVDSE